MLLHEADRGQFGERGRQLVVADPQSCGRGAGVHSPASTRSR
ncbi:hypothetical protein ACFWNN_38045 [Lentzea sp. NPDC058450]